MILSKHACKRMTQRGFDQKIIPLIFQYGSVMSMRNGSFKVMLMKKDILELTSENILPIQLLDKVTNRLLVLTNDTSKVITLY